MNMQYAQAVLAHEQAQRQRLNAGPTTARYAPPSGRGMAAHLAIHSFKYRI